MFVGVIEGLVRFVVMDGAVVVMVVMVDAFIVLKLVDERGCAANGRQATLHGETIQWQAQQQEDIDNPAHGNH